MTIWVDADACPKMIKEIIYKAAQKRKRPVCFVANHYFSVPKSPFIKFTQVSQGFDIADNHIVQSIEKDDLLISSDIPLADEALAKGAHVITPRGEILDKNNIKGRLNIRDFNETMRSSGIQSGGPPAMTDKDKQKFANAFDRYCQKYPI
jgi:hypothetical protein